MKNDIVNLNDNTTSLVDNDNKGFQKIIHKKIKPRRNVCENEANQEFGRDRPI